MKCFREAIQANVAQENEAKLDVYKSLCKKLERKLFHIDMFVYCTK